MTPCVTKIVAQLFFLQGIATDFKNKFLSSISIWNSCFSNSQHPHFTLGRKASCNLGLSWKLGFSVKVEIEILVKAANLHNLI